MMQTQYGSTSYNSINLQTIDTQADGFVTFYESYEWTKSKISDGSIASYTDIASTSVPEGYSQVGIYSSFKHPTHIDGSFSSWLAPPNKGLCGIVESLLVNKGSSIGFARNSVTTLVGNKSVIVENNPDYLGSTLSMGSGSILKGENKNKLSFTSSTDDVSGSHLDLYGVSILENLDIYNEGEFYFHEGATIQNSLLENNGSIWLVSGILNFENMQINTGEMENSIIKLGLSPGLKESPKIVLTNNSEWNFKGSFEGNKSVGLEIKDGSKFLVKESSLLLKTIVDVTDWGEFILTDDFSLYESVVNVYNSGIFNFLSGGTYNLDNLLYSSINVGSGGQVAVDVNSTLNLNSSVLNMAAGSIMTLKDGSNLKGSYSFPASTKLSTNGDCSIEGNFTFSPNSRMSAGGVIGNFHPKTIIKSGSNVTLNQANLYIAMGTEVKIESGAKMVLNGPLKVVVGPGARINHDGIIEAGDVEWIYGFEEFTPGLDKTVESWDGIALNPGSSVVIRNSDFSGVSSAIYGAPESITITGCTFTDCDNGISLINCNNYDIRNNTLTGKDQNGIGVSLVSSDGIFNGNTVTNFGRGIEITLGSPLISNNTVTDNRNYGFYITGYNAVPQFINPSTSQSVLNNTIKDNGKLTSGGFTYFWQSAQLYLQYAASAYLDNGKNNIHSGAADYLPSVPSVRGDDYYSAVASKAALPMSVTIKAKNNYWGYKYDIDSSNENYFFDMWDFGTETPLDGYHIDYSDYVKAPFVNSNPAPSPGVVSPESKLLSNAIGFEQDGKYKPSIKLYEQITKKHVDTPEYYVAMARLPYVYLKAEQQPELLLSVYDEGINSEDTSNKKFFKEMKVTANLKSKKYDEAIMLAEEMKLEAQTEGEILLAELDIAIAEMMKNHSGKSRNGNNSGVKISEIMSELNKISSKNPYSNPTDIADNILPSQHELFQNYPNPFNPVTQINFALSKTADVKLSVYNINGQKVAELANGVMNAGSHAVDFDGSKLNSGVYYYTLEADGIAMTKKMVLTK
jgi:parallel beta-helix repeat protein